jgi:hypothetical protein
MTREELIAIQDAAKLKMERAWNEVQRTSPSASSVRNCPSDSDANYHAMRAYQGARAVYLDTLKLSPVNSTQEEASYHEH